MPLRSLGYVAKNLTLDLTTGRTLRLASLTEERVGEVIAANLDALERILAWNVERDIRAFRISSGLVPFASHPAMPLDWEARFGGRLDAIGRLAVRERLRLSTHPGQYVVLGSPHEGVVERALAELEYHARLLERVSRFEGGMTLHLGGAYGDPESAKRRFRAAFARLSPAARARLQLENDDRTYGAEEALDLAEELGVPMVFDFHHHRVLPGRDGAPGRPALLRRVLASWGGRMPKLHLSTPRGPGQSAHADYIDPEDLRDAVRAVDEVAPDVAWDLMLEAKAKDRALLALRERAPGLES